MEEVEAGRSFILLYISSGIGSCGMLLLFVYNLVVLIGFMREKSEEAASGLSKATWAVGALSLVLGPCAWLGALVAIIMARVETGRIYAGNSTIRSATPARMGSVNGGVILALYFLIAAGTAATMLI